jgi:hypothetical protein
MNEQVGFNSTKNLLSLVKRNSLSGAVMPITTDDQIPTRGFTPTMAEHAIAFDSKLKATVSPASAS